ncbi:COL12 protein, partial [Polypterus senegalus]
MSSKIRKVESDLKDVAASNHWRDFDGHKYYFSTKMNSWEFARNACANVSSYLVVITSDLEKAFISSHILDKSWVGLNDLDKESVWKWITGQPMDKSGLQSQFTALSFVFTEKQWGDNTCPERHPGATSGMALLIVIGLRASLRDLGGAVVALRLGICTGNRKVARSNPINANRDAAQLGPALPERFEL